MHLFRNDYSVGAHPKVLEALTQTNLEGVIGYGQDHHCQQAAKAIEALCQMPCAVEFLVGGTQVNFIAIAAMLRPWEGVISPDTGHINGHESGAVEATGHKILQVTADEQGKITPDQIRAVVEYHGDTHLVLPKLVYISQATEFGRVYTLAELEALSAVCKELNLYLFVDGARLGYALSAVDCDVTIPDLARLTDAFTIGGTKNGALMGEALIMKHPEMSEHFFRIKKQHGGVLAKGWLLGAQFCALLKDNLYFNLAAHANQMATLLQVGLKELGLTLHVETTTNQVFVQVPDGLIPQLQEVAAFETWCPASEGYTAIRFVTSFHTSKEDVAGLLGDLGKLLQ